MRPTSVAALIGIVALLPCAGVASTIFCPELDEQALRESLRRAYAEADLVAFVDPQPVAVFSGWHEEQYELLVRSVWKGNVGRTIYVDGSLHSDVFFATREGDSGPFKSLGPCVAPSFASAAAVVNEIFGTGRPPSDDIRETRFTPLEKMAVLAGAGAGLAVLIGLVWILSNVLGLGRNRMWRARNSGGRRP
jgi:hypothetical protein